MEKMADCIVKRVGVYALIGAAGLLWVSAHAQTPASTTLPAFPSEALLRGEAAQADFDGDRRPDFAVAEPNYSANGQSYRVNVHLSGNPGNAFEVLSQIPGGLHVTPLDVDGDHDLDLVITTEDGSQPVGVWINDGKGAFSQDIATEYPSSIWQPSKTWFEAPERTETRTWLLVVTPDASRAPLTHGAALLPKPDCGPLYAIVVRPDFLLGHTSGPLRAPPLA